VNPLPVVDAATSPVSLCINDPAITLTGVPNGGSFTGLGVSGNSFNPATAGVGSHPVTYTYTDVNGCSNSGIATYIVNPLPVIDAGQSFVVPMGTVIKFTSTANTAGLTYYWDPAYSLSDPSVLNPTLTATTDEMFTLTATSAAGCTASDFITVKILQPVTVPNAFSPNGDGIHDTWLIRNLSDYPGAIVEVFNRYGQQVFYSSGYGTPWDGKMNGKPVPVGVYYYVIQLKNGFKPMSGSITILR
jgi:gliding motility-associated-like protein